MVILRKEKRNWTKMSKTNDAAEEEYSVEKVLNRRVRNGKVSAIYLVIFLLSQKNLWFFYYCCAVIGFALPFAIYALQYFCHYYHCNALFRLQVIRLVLDELYVLHTLLPLLLCFNDMSIRKWIISILVPYIFFCVIIVYSKCRTNKP